MAQWNFDLVHSSVNFTARHLVISKVRGRFTQWGGTLEFDEAHPEQARLEVRIQTASVDTNDPQRDAHLRSADFLDVEKYPEMVFHSRGVTVESKDRFRVQGELTLHGVTRPLALEMVEYAGHTADPWGGERAGFSASVSLSRKEFGLTFNPALETGGAVVGDRIEIALEIEAVAAKAQAAS
ncbi:MAG: YceI family protein [Terriglobales bacterium]